MKPVFDATIQELLHERLLALENYFNADSIFFYGAINDGLDKPFRDLIEELKANSNSREIRAEQIASLLGNNSHWLSHGRSIDASTLSNFVKLRIENYSNDAELTTLVRDYNDLICQYIQRSGIETFFHTRTFI